MASISRTRSTDPSVFLLVGEAVPFVGVALLTAWRTRWRQAAVRHEGQIEFWVPAMSVSVTWDEALSAHRACRGDLGLAAVQDGEADVHRVDLVVACSPRSGLAGPAVKSRLGGGRSPAAASRTANTTDALPPRPSRPRLADSGWSGPRLPGTPSHSDGQVRLSSYSHPRRNNSDGESCSMARASRNSSSSFSSSDFADRRPDTSPPAADNPYTAVPG